MTPDPKLNWHMSRQTFLHFLLFLRQCFHLQDIMCGPCLGQTFLRSQKLLEHNNKHYKYYPDAMKRK